MDLYFGVGHGLVFWDVTFLQERGLVDMLDEEDEALGLNITDGIVEDAEKILAFVRTELDTHGLTPRGT